MPRTGGSESREEDEGRQSALQRLGREGAQCVSRTPDEAGSVSGEMRPGGGEEGQGGSGDSSKTSRESGERGSGGGPAGRKG